MIRRNCRSYAGADAIVAQGMEAGGHRGAFDADRADREMVGLMALLPQVVDAVAVPVIATGGIADARGVAAAPILGASAVQIGTGLLRTPEAMTHPACADRLARTEAHETTVTRAFSGRPGRAALDGPLPAPYPIQRGLTSPMRESARKQGDAERMQMWAGQAAKLARAEPAGVIVQQLWDNASRFFAKSAGSWIRRVFLPESIGVRTEPTAAAQPVPGLPVESAFFGRNPA